MVADHLSCVKRR